MQNFILYKMVYLVFTFELKAICRLSYSFQLTVSLMRPHVDVSISFLGRTISYTEKTNIYKNQIILSMLSA